ncbi:hypothetical protein GCM10009566_17320 [Streptomyces murinus]
MGPVVSRAATFHVCPRSARTADAAHLRIPPASAACQIRVGGRVPVENRIHLARRSINMQRAMSKGTRVRARAD